MATDFKIRSALKGTRYSGSYMTDIIKDFEEKASGKMMRYLCNNRDFEHENIQILKTEIEVLGAGAPLLIAFGKDAEKIARRNRGNEFQIIGIPHYANYISREVYRQRPSPGDFVRKFFHSRASAEKPVLNQATVVISYPVGRPPLSRRPFLMLLGVKQL
jgi:hypothetical protein